MQKISRLGLKIQYISCICLIISGITLLFMGFLVDPIGIIDNSILIAFGEISTFAGSLIGIDYNYRVKSLQFTNKRKEDDEVEEL